MSCIHRPLLLLIPKMPFVPSGMCAHILLDMFCSLLVSKLTFWAVHARFRYLKTVILPHMRDNIREIEKYHAVRTLSDEEMQHRLATMSKSARKAKGELLPTTTDVWLWRTRARPSPPPEPKKEKPVFGIEVGVGEDWSHLNKRRQRARGEKVARDVTWLRDLEKIRRERAALERAAKRETTA